LTKGAAVELVPRKFEEMPSGVRLVLFSNREEVTQSSFLKGTRPHRGGSDDECVHEVSWSFRSVSKFSWRGIPSLAMAGTDDESNQVP